MHQHLLSAVLLSGSLAFAQTTIYVPDNQAAVGTCNAIPLDSSFAAATTYVGRIPVSFMGTSPVTIQDIQFAPCNTATFTAANMQIGIGHVPSLTTSITFPSFDAGGNMIGLGSFLDYTPLWNSVVQGPFTYAMTANTWCSLGFAATGGTHFTWNGTNDVAFFLTWSSATGGGPCHRTSTEPFRFYNSGVYQAPSSSGSGAAGLKMGLVTGWPTLCAGCGGMTFGVTGTSSLGGALTATLGSYGSGIPFVGLGFGPFCLAPVCPGCIIGHSWSVALFGSSATLNIPNNQVFLGVQVGFQGAGLTTPGGCTSPPVALSDTIAVTITP